MVCYQLDTKHKPMLDWSHVQLSENQANSNFILDGVINIYCFGILDADNLSLIKLPSHDS